MEKRFELTGTELKIIAVITMFIDHFAAGLLEREMQRSGYYIDDFFMGLSILQTYDILRAIGRMAFPIYCYLLVEGFVHTHNLKKYILRILVVAIASELPFDYLFYNTFFHSDHNNVMWELALGLVVLYCYSKVDELALNNFLIYILRVCIMCVSMAIATFANLDYRLGGILCISVMYYLRGTDTKRNLTAFATGVFVLALGSGMIEAVAFLMLIPMYFYHGTRGRDSKYIRLFFYWFYPVHLILLGIVANLIY